MKSKGTILLGLVLGLTGLAGPGGLDGPWGPGGLGGPGALAAQEVDLLADDLPDAVAEEVVAFFNDPGTLRFSGASRIPAGRTIEGDLAILGGPLSIAGTIRGRVVVVNGDVQFEADGRILGDLLVIGGVVEGSTPESVAGGVTVYSERMRYRRRGAEITYAGEGDEREPEISGNLGVGSIRFTVRAGTNYNRVEGLPVVFGPILDTSGSNPLRLELLAIWRTDSGFTLDPDLMGYQVMAEQRLGGRREFSIGGTLHRQYHPIEAWGLSNLEASLATFLLHEDYRDYFQRQGWSVFGRYTPRSAPVSLKVEYREDEHEFGSVGSPWSVTRNSDPWRPQPLVAEGKLRSIAAEVELDTRNDRKEPSSGFLVQANVRGGVGGDWAYPVYENPFLDIFPPALVEPGPVETDFFQGFLDARSYNRIAPSATLNFRALLGGSLDGDPLPNQYQRALGGSGSMPGYDLFYGDCSARDVTVNRPAAGDEEAPVPVFAGYGCDRIAMFQVEVRSGFSFSVDVGGDEEDDRWRWIPVIDLSPGWSAFFNAGKGWALGDKLPGGILPRDDTSDMMDLGLGLHLGGLAVYWAYPLAGDADKSKFLVRLSHRF